MSRPLKKRQQHLFSGHYTLKAALRTVSQQAQWLDAMGEVGQALQQWRTAMINDLGGEHAISAMQSAVVELATKTYLMLDSVDKFLLAQQSLVNRSRRQLFPIVLQRQQLADALARYMNQLGLERRVRQPLSLEQYLASNGKPPSSTGAE
jgi:hypothetical protein